MKMSTSQKYLIALIVGFVPSLSGCLEFHAKELDVEVTPVPESKDAGSDSDEESVKEETEDS